jgi:hypothetical protein
MRDCAQLSRGGCWLLLFTTLFQVNGCGYGVTCHVRTFLHGCSRVTLSIATLPSSDALPGEERGQVRVCF